MANTSAWLPLSREEMEERGWDTADIIIVSGDAYVDHPSFGHAIIARVLESKGFRVAILAQPNWRDDLRDFIKLGKPRLFFGVTSGCMDSMINHYTANKRKRSDDAYTPGGQTGFRPDYADIVYSRILKQLFPDTPVVLGGVEASLRRLTHYDYWSDALKPSILAESGADLLVYGMGEEAILAVADGLSNGIAISELREIPQTAYPLPQGEAYPPFSLPDVVLFSHSDCLKDKRNYARNFVQIERESNRLQPARIIQESTEIRVVVNPPFPPVATPVLDSFYELPFTRLPHPRYAKRGNIPAWEMIRNSVNIHRGCFGGCSFCTISAHQGRFVQSRSEDSICREVQKVVETPGFSGTISDLGGPSANMYRMSGTDPAQCAVCRRTSCVWPSVCPNLNTDHSPLVELYRRVGAMPRIKNVFVGSGIRYDLFMQPDGSIRKQKGHEAYARQLIQHHVSGRLKVAPEHCSDEVLKRMRKPSFELFRHFRGRFEAFSSAAGKQQQLIPYFISSHPGSRPLDMALLAVEAKAMKYRPEQTQDFTPTPMTLATVMYYTGLDPYTLKPLYVANTPTAKQLQQKMLYWYKPENRREVEKYLQGIHRSDLTQKLYGKPGRKGK